MEFAVVEIEGKQYKVSPKDKIVIEKLSADKGKKVTFDGILLFSNGKKTDIGTPFLKDRKVEAKVIEHGRGENITVFKKKRRKGYQVKRGHRQHYTTIEIEKIS